MNSHTSAAVKGLSLGLVTAIVDGESQSSKEVINHTHGQIVWKDILPGYLSPSSKETQRIAVVGPLNCADQH